MSAKKKLSPSRICGRRFSYLVAGILLLGMSNVCRADALEDAARALARRVTKSMKGATVTFEMENLSDLKDDRISQLSVAFQEELQRQGVRISPKTGNAKILLAISRNASMYLGIARLERNESSDVFLEPFGQPAEGFFLQETEGLTLRRELIFSSDRPILDLNFPGENPNRIEVLESRQIASYERDRDHWVPVSILILPRIASDEREPQGRFFRGIQESSVVFPNEICKLPIREGDHCRPARQSAEEKGFSSWVTSAEIPNEGRKILLIAGDGGKIRIYGEGSQFLTEISSFGDQLSTIQTVCASGWITLVTLVGDRTKTDSIQGIKIRNLKPIAVTQALPFEGPVVALHQNSVASAIAIELNLQSGFYEAYRITVTCPN